ncbi:MAG: zinc-dependent metalloprotease [Flavobacteriales bacterium]|nr:zinc-dependent metalloprotease [Flavobacteriales bacterium]
MRAAHFLWIVLAYSPSLIAQNRSVCTTSELQKNSCIHHHHCVEPITLLHHSSVSNRSAETIQIPVVFHVLWHTNAENVSNEEIFLQLEILNDHMRREHDDTTATPDAWQNTAAGIDVEFCLAAIDPDGNTTTGIERRETDIEEWYTPFSFWDNDDVKHYNMGGLNAWDSEHYLNVWVCRLMDSGGYATPPLNSELSDDGIVVNNELIGTWGFFSEGLTLVHEVGHWLCLKHTWGDDAGECTGTDYIADTPNQSGPQFNCPEFPTTDLCSPISPGVMFMNYMDYTLDECKNIFTQEQCEAMMDCLVELRTGIVTSNGCSDNVFVQEKNHPVFSVHPNPARETIEIEMNANDLPVEFSVCDLMGHRLISFEASSVNALFDISALNPGVYIISAIFREGTAVRNIVVE